MSKRTFKEPNKAHFIFFLLIVLSGGGLFYIKTLPDAQQNIWLMLLLLLVLMYSLMKSTRHWAYDNPKEKEDDKKEKIEYKNPEIPSLDEMIKKQKKE